MGCTQGHDLSLYPFNLSPALVSKPLFPTILQPLLQLMDGRRCQAACAVSEDWEFRDPDSDWRGLFNQAVPARLCQTLPTLYAALAVAAAEPLEGSGGSSSSSSNSSNALACCRRYDVERFRAEAGGEGGVTGQLSCRSSRFRDTEREVSVDFLPGMSVGGVLRCTQHAGMPAALGVLMQAGRPRPPPHHLCTLASLQLDPFSEMRIAGPPPGDLPPEQLRELLDMGPVPCALCQSPEHLAAAQALQAGPGEVLLQGMAAAAEVMRAGWAARGGV